MMYCAAVTQSGRVAEHDAIERHANESEPDRILASSMQQLSLFPVEARSSIGVPVTNQTTNALRDGVFGWYHYVQDFHGEFALDWIRRLAMPGDVIWDPFSGSGTTVLASKLAGHASFGYDVNPLMVDVARAKTDWTVDPTLLDSDIDVVAALATQCAANLGPEPAATQFGKWEDYEYLQGQQLVAYPSDKVLYRWISARPLARFNSLLGAVRSVEDEPRRRFLTIAAAAIMMAAANVRGRPNVSYNRRPTIDFPVINKFVSQAHAMVRDYTRLRDLALPSATVLNGDARSAGPAVADVIFTSPPYPNDMEYVHQTRLELALLGYAHDATELTSLKKRMISSSVKLVYSQNAWQKSKGLQNERVARLHERINETLAGRRWGWNAADMVAHYFGGMQSVLKNWHQRLSADGRVGCVIGDSAFNGVRVRSDELLAEIAEREGFSATEVRVFRSRWHNKHSVDLRESVVILTKRTS